LTLAELEADFAAVPWPELALHPDAALLDWPALVVDEVGAVAWRNGRPLPGGAGAPGERCRVYSHEGDWLGLGAYDAETGAWRPEKVVVL
jgi:hypothetical protein